jgi:hypothetical protein
MLLNYTGFETGVTTAGEIQSEIVKSGKHALRLGPEDASTLAFKRVVPVVYSRFWLYYDKPGEFFSYLDAEGRSKVRLVINRKGLIEIHTNQFKGLGPFLRSHQWHLVEFKSTTGVYGVYSLRCKGITTEGIDETMLEPTAQVKLGGGIEGYFDDLVADDSVFVPKNSIILGLNLASQKFNKHWIGRPPKMTTLEPDSSAFYRLNNPHKINKIIAIKPEAFFETNRKCALKIKQGTSCVKTASNDHHVTKIMEKNIKTGKEWTRQSLNNLELGLFSDNKSGRIVCNHLGVEVLCH